MQDRFRYVTPYGKWNAKLQDHGAWAASFRVTAGPPALGVRALDRAAKEYGDPPHPDLPAVHSLTPDDCRINWVLPDATVWTPLVALPEPLPPGEVRRVVFAVGDLLKALHAAGGSAGDLSPELVFLDGSGRVTLLPTFGLADLSGVEPAGVAEMVFVAPEYGGTAPVDPVRADVFGLGALAWWLANGAVETTRGVNPALMVDPLAGDWEAFVHGCAAESPAERYETVGAALAVLARSLPDDPSEAPTLPATPLAKQAAAAKPTNAPRPVAVMVPVVPKPAGVRKPDPLPALDRPDALGLPDVFGGLALVLAAAGAAVAYAEGDRNWLIALFGGGGVFLVLSLLGGGKK